MNAATASPREHGVPGGGVDDLIAFLRTREFQVGPSEALDAARLLAHLAARGSPAFADPDPAWLIPKLRPVLCKRAQDQDRFDTVFREWLNTRMPRTTAPAGQAVAVPAAVKPATSMWRIVPGLVFALILLLAWWDSTHRKVDAPAAPTVRQDAAPAVQAPQASAPVAPRVRSHFDGYYPAVRYNQELQPWVAGALLGLGVLGLLGLSVPLATPWLAHARRSGRRVPLDLSSLREEARRVVPPLAADIQARLERHVPGPAEARARLQRRPPLHVGRTIEATLRRLGVLSLRHRDARLRPSYLLIVEVDGEGGQSPQQLVSDPRGRMFYHWAERLRKRGIEVDIRLARFDADAQTALTCRPVGTGWQLDGNEGEPLDCLPTPPVGQRLVIISDGTLLIDENDRWRDWARRARFHRWPQRVVFTPTEPRSWGPREDVLEERERPTDPGFYVLPLDEPALAAWAGLLVTGRLPRFTLSRSQRYPARLRALEAANQVDALLNRDTPIDGLAELLDQLKHYLGENGYYWLCACAVPPIVRWELTLLLGEQYYLNARLPQEELPDYIAHDYPRLAMLPWLRRQYMPDWLRLALLDSLSPRLQEEVRAVVRSRLGQIRLDTQGDDALSLEEPPGPLGRARATGADAADTLYLGYLAGHTPHQLMLRAPREWSGWLARLPIRQRSGLWREWLAAWRDRLLWRKGLSFFGASRRMTAASAALLSGVAVVAAAAAFADPQIIPSRVRDALYVHQGRWVGGVQSAAISAVAYRAADQAIVSRDQNGMMQQWDVRTGAPIGPSTKILPEEVRNLGIGGIGAVEAFSPDGSRGVSGDADGMLWVWDAKTGRLIAAPSTSSTTPITSVAFSPDGAYVAAGSADATVRMWNPITGEAVNQPLRGTGGAVSSVAFSADGSRLVAGSEKGGLLQWDIRSGRAIYPPMAGHAERVSSVAFSPEGAYIVSGSADGSMRLWDAANGQAVGPLMRGHEGAVTSVVFNPPGTEIISGGEDGSVRFWDPRLRGERSGELPIASLGGERRMNRALFSPDGNTVLTVAADRSVRLWDAASGKTIGAPMPHGGVVLDAVFSPDGALIATAGADGATQLWDAASGLPRVNLLLHGASVVSVRFSPDGQRLATASADYTARIWDTASGAQLAELQHDGPVSTAVFSPDGQLLLTASDDGSARIWTVKDGARRTTLVHKDAVRDAAFSPDGQSVVTASADRSAALWRVADGSRLHTLEHPDAVALARFSPDGARVLTASQNTVRIWDAGSGAPLGAALEHDSMVFGASFSPDGQQILTTSPQLDGAARLWDGHSGVPLGPSISHRSVVWSASFSPDGERIVTAWGSDPPPLAAQQGSAGVQPVPQRQQQKLLPKGPDLKGAASGVTPMTVQNTAADTAASAAATQLDAQATANALKGIVVRKALDAAGNKAALAAQGAAQSGGSAAISQSQPANLGGALIWRVPPNPLPLGPPAFASGLWASVAAVAALGLWAILLLARRRRQMRQLQRWMQGAQT